MEAHSESKLNNGDLRSLKNCWVHFVAIGGTGVGALAALLQDQGAIVTGSDGPLYPPMSTFLASRKIPMKTEYSSLNLEGATWGLKFEFPQIVVVGNAISRSNVEAMRVEELLALQKIKRMSHAEALAESAIGDRKSLVVAGTHGKSTTTSILTWALESLHKNPGFFIGGLPKNFESGCRLGTGNIFVSEGDEYDTAYWDKESKFLHYRPHWVLCTGIEFDHADIFKDLQAIEKMFVKLSAKTREGFLLIDSDSSPKPASTEVLAAAIRERGLKLFRYGKKNGSDFQLLSCQATPIQKSTLGTKILFKSQKWGSVELLSPMTGEHNALNLCGVLGLLIASGELDKPEEAQKFLSSFQGIKRRQEEVFVSDELIVIDDFAHHPTAIRETVDAIKSRYPTSQVAAFFEARSATSSRQVMADDFAKCFDNADALFLSPPTKLNIPEAEKLDVFSLMESIKARPENHGKCFVLNKENMALVEEFRKWRISLKSQNKKQVVALVMSNGPFGGIHKILAEKG